MVYIATFLCSIIFGHLATRINPKTNRGLVFFCSAVSILIPSILAGLRDISVGTDISVYVADNFNLAVASETFSQYASRIWQKEWGYMFLVFFSSKIFPDVQGLLFSIELIMMVCVFLGAWKFREQVPLPLVLAIYFLFFYNMSYNIVRQSIAVAIIFLATSWLFEKKYIHFFIAVAVAVLFHKTAMVGIGQFLIFWFINSKSLGENDKARKLRGNAMVVGAVAFCFLLPYLTRALVSLGIISSRFLQYFEISSVSDNLLNSLVYLLEIVFVMLFSKNFEKISSEFVFLKTNLFFTFITHQLTNFMYYGDRLSLYFSVVNIILLAKLPQATSSKRDKTLATIAIVAVLLFYWYYIYIISGSAETYPYIAYWESSL